MSDMSMNIHNVVDITIEKQVALGAGTPAWLTITFIDANNERAAITAFHPEEGVLPEVIDKR